MYHNTNNERGSTLSDSHKKAGAQGAVILALFRDNPEKLYCAAEVKEKIALDCLLTSVRRSITDLTKDKQLIKTDAMRDGGFGKKTYCYKFNLTDPQLKMAI